MYQGNKLKEERKARQISQAEFAAALGVSVSAVSRYEAGQRNLRPDQLEAAAAILGISVIDLLDVEPEKRAELEQIQEILSGIRERELEGQYLSDADQWIEPIYGFLKRLIDRELAIATLKMDAQLDAGENKQEERKTRKRMNRLDSIVETLNDEGQRRVIELAKDLSCIPIYQRTPSSGTDNVEELPGTSNV